MWCVCLDVSTDSRRLCSVNTGPISLITIWHLENKSPILSAKIYGKEVMRVTFSPYSNDQITSYGKGHVMFWNIANTNSIIPRYSMRPHSKNDAVKILSFNIDCRY